MNVPIRTRRPATRRRRRGALYLLVLLVSLLVSTGGLAAIATVGVDRDAAELRDDAAVATLNARAAFEMALFRLDNDTTNRVAFTDGTFGGQTPMPGGGTYEFAMIDPEDDDLTDDTTDPITIRATGRYGAAVRTLEGTVDFVQAFGPNLLSNGDAESGATSPWLVAFGWQSVSSEVRGGNHSILADLNGFSASEISHWIGDGLTNGGTYYASAWVRADSGSVDLHMELHLWEFGELSPVVIDVGDEEQAQSNGWTHLLGSATASWDPNKSLAAAYLVIEADQKKDFLIDDAMVSERKLAPVLTGSGITRVVN